jgi:hypothetical protein
MKYLKELQVDVAFPSIQMTVITGAGLISSVGAQFNELKMTVL